jgi:hypothetical protein
MVVSSYRGPAGCWDPLMQLVRHCSACARCPAAQVFAINSLAPFILNSKLKPAMQSPFADSEGRVLSRAAFIVNVSAMEGKFYRHKSPTHPHTNMAKAALNMMTRTSAAVRTRPPTCRLLAFPFLLVFNRLRACVLLCSCVVVGFVFIERLIDSVAVCLLCCVHLMASPRTLPQCASS